MKKINIAKITWISCIFLGLIVILIMVMDYKIHYQYKTINKIYFYDCDGTLCVTEVKDDEHLMYSQYECGHDECPIFKSELNDTYAILNAKDNSILFNYRNGKVISADYTDYQLLNNNYLIVTKEQYQGIINMNNEITVPLNYEQLGIIKENSLTGYNLSTIIAKKDNKYGLISLKNGNIIEPLKHEETEIDNLLKLLNEETNSLTAN